MDKRSKEAVQPAEQGQKPEKGRAFWSTLYVKARHPDADEPEDPVAANDYPALHDKVAVDPMKCLGWLCPLKSDVCDVCKLARTMQ